MKRINLSLAPMMVGISLFFAAVAGWMMNLVKFIGSLGDPLTTMFFGRVVGIFVAPLGAILGYL